MTCPICHLRKEKRFCLALHDRICPQCCGEQREVTLDCPSECRYLQQAREHEKPHDFGANLPDELFPAIEITQPFLVHHEPLIAGLLHTLLQAAQRDRALRDREIIAALTRLVHSYQTLVSSGLVYQESSANPVQAAIGDALQRSLEEFRKVERQHMGYTSLRDSDVLRLLVFMIRLAHLHTSGRPLSRGFLDYLSERLPDPSPTDEPAAQTGSRIILP